MLGAPVYPQHPHWQGGECVEEGGGRGCPRPLASSLGGREAGAVTFSPPPGAASGPVLLR